MRVNILREINVLSCKHHDLKNLRVKKPPLKVHNTNLMPSIKDCCSVAKLCQLLVTPWTAARQGSLSFTISLSLLKPYPSSRWCHPVISSSVIPFFSCPQAFPASGSFSLSQLFASGGQTIGDSASASAFQMHIQGWLCFRLTGLISLRSRDS